ERPGARRAAERRSVRRLFPATRCDLSQGEPNADSYQILMDTHGLPTRRSIPAHRSGDELAARDRRANDPVARRHGPVLWLLAPGRASTPVARVTGDTVHGIRPIARRSNPEGPAGLEDRRQHHPGAVGLLAPAQRQGLSAALAPPPPAGGIWTGPQAAAWMAATLGRHGHPPRGWEALRRWGRTSTGPRPRHTTAAPRAPAAWKPTA